MASNLELEEIYNNLAAGKVLSISYEKRSEVATLLAQLHRYRTKFELHAKSIGLYTDADCSSIQAKFNSDGKSASFSMAPKGVRKQSSLSYTFIDPQEAK